MSSGNFKIFEINSAFPELLSEKVIYYGGGGEISINEDIVIIPKRDIGFYTIDISDIFFPVIADSFEAEHPHFPVKHVFSDSLIYTANLSGFGIYNVNRLNKVNELFFFPTGGSAREVQLYDSKLFVYADYLNIFDLTGDEPQLFAQYSNTFGIKDIAISDSLLYILSIYGVSIVDWSNASDLIDISHFPLEFKGAVGQRPSLELYKQKLYVTTGIDSITVIDISNLSEPQLDNKFKVHNFPYSLEVNQQYLYSSEANKGLRIYDLDNDLMEVASFSERRFSFSKTYNDTIFASVDDGLAVYKFDGQNIEEISYLPTPGGRSIVRLKVHNHKVYMAYGRNLEVIDVKNIYNPHIKAYYRHHSISGIDVDDEHIYIPANGNGVLKLKEKDVTYIRPIDTPAVTSEFQFNIYPNPANNYGIISFTLKKRAKIKIYLYDSIGREIETIFNNYKEQGHHKLHFNFSKYSSGLYLINMKLNGNNNKQNKLILIK